MDLPCPQPPDRDDLWEKFWKDRGFPDSHKGWEHLRRMVFRFVIRGRESDPSFFTKELADQVSNEALSVVYLKYDFAQLASVETYAFAVLRNLVRSEYREYGRRLHHQHHIGNDYSKAENRKSQLNRLSDGDPEKKPLIEWAEYETPERILERREEIEQLYEALEVALDSQEQAIVMEHWFENKTFREIEAQYNLPLSTVKSIYYRALPKLKEYLMRN